MKLFDFYTPPPPSHSCLDAPIHTSPHATAWEVVVDSISRPVKTDNKNNNLACRPMQSKLGIGNTRAGSAEARGAGHMTYQVPIGQ